MTTTVSGSQEVEVVSCDVGRCVKAGKGGIFVIYFGQRMIKNVISALSIKDLVHFGWGGE